MNSKNLFSDKNWFVVEQEQQLRIKTEIAQLDGNRLLNTSIENLCEYFIKKYWINVPVLNKDEVILDQGEVQIDVSKDPFRFIRDPSRPFYVTGTSVEISIPFSGDEQTFYIRPSTYFSTTPQAIVQKGLLLITIKGTDLAPDWVRGEIDRNLTNIQSNLQNLQTNVNAFNNNISIFAREVIEQRRRKLLADRHLVASLGYKLKEREDSPKTYVAPEIRRKIIPTLPPASSSPFKPEPTISGSDYDHILTVIENMALVMERSPSAFVNIDEESLRFYFIMQLNGHYEGQATGETFNYQGKTDILIRSDGKNVFIAECKFWDGARQLLETIDQVLTYSSWRDTKVAVIIFNRRKDLD